MNDHPLTIKVGFDVIDIVDINEAEVRVLQNIHYFSSIQANTKYFVDVFLNEVQCLVEMDG